MDASEAEEFSEVATKPLRSLPYDSPGQTFVAFEKPEGVPAVGKFSNMLRFIGKEVKVLSLSLKMCCLYSQLFFFWRRSFFRVNQNIVIYKCYPFHLGLLIACHKMKFGSRYYTN